MSHAVGCAFQLCTQRKEKPAPCGEFSRFDPLRVTSVSERSTHIRLSDHFSDSVRSKASGESNTNERPRPKGTQISGVVCHNPLRIIDLNQSMFMAKPTQNRFEQRKHYPEPSMIRPIRTSIIDTSLFFSVYEETDDPFTVRQM